MSSGVGVMVGVAERVGEGMMVEVEVGPGVEVTVGEGVVVHNAAVAVIAWSVVAACSSGLSPQADSSIARHSIRMQIAFILFSLPMIGCFANNYFN
jgi:hypothetical protein